MITLLVHIANAEAIKVDVEEMPKASDMVLLCKNPREKTEKEVTWLEQGVNTLILPWWRIIFIEILPSSSDEAEFPLPFRND